MSNEVKVRAVERMEKMITAYHTHFHDYQFPTLNSENYLYLEYPSAI